jgi:hypothetical protein
MRLMVVLRRRQYLSHGHRIHSFLVFKQSDEFGSDSTLVEGEKEGDERKISSLSRMGREATLEGGNELLRVVRNSSTVAVAGRKCK